MKTILNETGDGGIESRAIRRGEFRLGRTRGLILPVSNLLKEFFGRTDLGRFGVSRRAINFSAMIIGATDEDLFPRRSGWVGAN